MTNKLDQMLDEILNKKFNKKIHAGYDPEDVDAFFDYVINYLKELNVEANKLFSKTNNSLDEIKKLNLVIYEKNKHIEMLQQQIDEYKQNGYDNQRLQQKLQSLEQKIESVNKRVEEK